MTGTETSTTSSATAPEHDIRETVDERQAAGKAARKRAPRSALARWDEAAEEEVFGEGGIVRVDGILEEEIAEGDNAGRGLEGYHEDAYLTHNGNKKVHLDDAEDGEGLVEVGDDEGEQRGVE